MIVKSNDNNDWAKTICILVVPGYWVSICFCHVDVKLSDAKYAISKITPVVLVVISIVNILKLSIKW